ncbi:MAG: hypothetical protein HWD59_05295 [Coxiellaceae bacterium]|nr:MAG: hypothetical protein HWD59_05295 [Coxiellaceae bacterium]
MALSGKMTTQQISELFELLRTNHGVHSLDLRALPIETDQQEELLSKLMECNTPVRQIVLPEVEEKTQREPARRSYSLVVGCGRRRLIKNLSLF